jgi:hypothetical protein
VQKIMPMVGRQADLLPVKGDRIGKRALILRKGCNRRI